MRSHSYINTVTGILKSYDGSQPLAAWLKNFFRDNKKMGSSDRRQIAHLCYVFCRLGHAFDDLPVEEKILLAAFLCSTSENLVLKEQKPEWNEKVHLPLEEKISIAGVEKLLSEKIFPLEAFLSPDIDGEIFKRSFLIQPDLFLRIRPGKERIVREQLDAAFIAYTNEREDCLRLANTTKVEDILMIDRDLVVQDLSSQQVLDPLIPLLSAQKNIRVWDCCAASGGKSLLFRDRFPNSILTVSDIRESIILNLRNRFKRAGITDYHAFVADVSAPGFRSVKKMDVVLCDAPCTGSGTWSRTPEQLRFFTPEKIDHYAGLQQKIVSHAAGSVQPGGYFLYSTCSVFARENEEVVRFAEENLRLQQIHVGYIKGYADKADTLFTALFRAL